MLGFEQHSMNRVSTHETDKSGSLRALRVDSY